MAETQGGGKAAGDVRNRIGGDVEREGYRILQGQDTTVKEATRDAEGPTGWRRGCEERVAENC